MGYVLFTRNPATKKLIAIVENDDGDISEFKTEDEAEAAANDTTVCKAWGYQVIEVD